MDPVSIVALTSTCVSLTFTLSKIVVALKGFADKYQVADLILQALAHECKTFEVGILSLQRWLDTQSVGLSIDDAVLGQLVESAELGALVASALEADLAQIQDHARKGFRFKSRIVWAFDRLKEHQDRLRGQVHALSLLLQILSLQSAVQQNRALLEQAPAFRKACESALTATNSLASRSTKRRDSAYDPGHGDNESDEGEVEYRPLDCENDLFTSDVYKRNFRHAFKVKECRPKRKPLPEGHRASIIFNGSIHSDSKDHVLVFGTSTILRDCENSAPESDSVQIVDTEKQPSLASEKPASFPETRGNPSLNGTQIIEVVQVDSAHIHQIDEGSLHSPLADAVDGIDAGDPLPKFSPLDFIYLPNGTSMNLLLDEQMRTSELQCPRFSIGNEEATKSAALVSLLTDNDVHTPISIEENLSPMYVNSNLMRGVVSQAVIQRVDYSLSLPKGERVWAIDQLRYACQQQLIEAVAFWLQVVDVDSPLHCYDRTGQLVNQYPTALHYAAEHGYTSTAAVLLDSGASLIVDSKTGVSPLHTAVAANQNSILALLLEKGSSPNIPTENGVYPLDVACRNGNLEAVKLLVDHGATLAREQTKASCIAYASSSGNNQLVSFLCGLDIAKPTLNIRQLEELLAEACKNGHVVVVDALLKHAKLRRMDTSTFQKPLAVAVANRHPLVVERLITDSGSGLFQRLPENGATLLHECISGVDRGSGTFYRRSDDLATLKVLLRYSVLVHLRDNLGNQPLHYAAAIIVFLNNVALIPFLNNAADGYDRRVGIDVKIKMLLDAGADLNAVNNEGETPLYVACRCGQPVAVKALLERGPALPSPDCPDSRLRSPYDALLIRQDGNVNEIRMLLDAAYANRLSSLNDQHQSPISSHFASRDHSKRSQLEGCSDRPSSWSTESTLAELGDEWIEAAEITATSDANDANEGQYRRVPSPLALLSLPIYQIKLAREAQLLDLDQAMSEKRAHGPSAVNRILLPTGC